MTRLEIIQTIKDEHAKRAKQIQADKNLSDFGKRAEMKKASDEKDAALLAMVPQLRHSVVEAGSKVSRLRGAKDALVAIEKDKLNFSRLSFEVETLRGTLERVKDDPDSMRQVFEGIIRTGDTYRLRAFQNLAGEFIPENSVRRSEEWGQLRETVKSSEGMEQGAEFQRYDKEEKSLLEDLHSVEVETQALAHELSSAQVGANITRSIFEGLSKDRDTGRIEVHFGNMSGDKTPADTEARLAKERQEMEILQAEYFERFGLQYNPLTDGLPEIDSDAA
jgi:hypothetical protein